MLNITEQQFFDYISCPAKYDMKYNKRINIEHQFKVSDLLIQVSHFFYTFVINFKKLPTLRKLTDKFDSLAKPYRDQINSTEYTNCIFQIQQFYNWACSCKLAVIDVNSKYVLRHKDMVIEGILNPIAINKDKRLEFLICSFNKRMPEELELNMKLKYTLDMYAFNKTFPDKQIHGLRYHFNKTNKEILVGRNSNDYARLNSTLDGVYAGITNKVFFPHETHQCMQCEYRYYCRGWKK